MFNISNHVAAATAAAAKSLQSCPTLCDPIDSSPPGSPIPGILQARVMEWGAITFSAAIMREILIKTTVRYHFILIRMTTIKITENTEVVKELEKLEPLHPVDGIGKRCNCYEKQYGGY